MRLGEMEVRRAPGRRRAAAPAGGREAPATWAAARPGSALAPGAARSARLFYQKVLGGRQVWRTGRADTGGSLWFLVGERLVEVGPDPRGVATPILLDVDDPDTLAERCWDAGFTVRVRQHPMHGPSLSLVDPFGRRIDLATASNHHAPALRHG
jgi:catechol 2,3-dioxygenase-like lactoylglutathione lyase family enzyme